MKKASAIDCNFVKRRPDLSSRTMQRVRSARTGPENALFGALKAAGLKVSRQASRLPGKPDLLIRTERVAIFVDGDFWHGNQWSLRNLSCLDEQFTVGGSHLYWTSKIRRNMARDAAVTARLLAEGWKVVRFWENDIRNKLTWCVDKVKKSIRLPHPMKDSLASKTFAEFFSGIGLMRLGLEVQGWNVAFANDFDSQKKELYEGHFGPDPGRFRSEDIHLLTPREIPAVTLATASFPCNDLSLAGSRNGLSGHNSSAFWGFFRLIQGMGKRKPPLLLLENVPGLITSHGGKDLRDLLLALNGAGYATDAFLLDASSFVPQSRMRLFVVAVALDCSHSMPSPTPNLEAETMLRPKLLYSFIKKNEDILWYLRHLPTPPVTSLRLEDILEDVPFENPAWWEQKRSNYLFKQLSPRHLELVESWKSKRTWSYGTVFRRMRNGKSMAELRSDGIAGCLRTPRGGSARQILVKVGYGSFHARLLTARECARLMGADQYSLSSDLRLNQALFGFGDAVCVPVVEWIAKYYLNPLVNELLHSRPPIEAKTRSDKFVPALV